jgi:hypothetical protein
MRILMLFILILAPTVVSATERVDDAQALKRAVQKAKSGDALTLAPGSYDITDLKIRRNLTLRGDGEVVLYSSAPTAKGLLNPLPGVSLRVENLVFRGARSPDKNGAGIRHDGRDLTIIDCVFEDNENGVLSTGDAEGQIWISGSRFLRNGHGDGYSHGIYVLRARLLEIQESAFIGTRIGHHVKSLADRTIVANSTLDDGDGRPSYSLDASKGGDVLIKDNTIIQAANADNWTMINYDLSRGGEAAGLTITGNRVINRVKRGLFLRIDAPLSPIVYDNEIINENGARLKYCDTGPLGKDC